MMSGLTEDIFKCNNKKLRWAVQVNALSRWMAIGICQTRQAQRHQFEDWSWEERGHGHYCICSDGKVYSHSDSNTNN